MKASTILLSIAALSTASVIPIAAAQEPQETATATVDSVAEPVPIMYDDEDYFHPYIAEDLRKRFADPEPYARVGGATIFRGEGRGKRSADPEADPRVGGATIFRGEGRGKRWADPEADPRVGGATRFRGEGRGKRSADPEADPRVGGATRFRGEGRG